MKRLARVYWPAYLLWQIFLARVVTIDFFDAAANLRNARTLSGVALGYTDYRPPMVSILQAPLARLLSAAGAGPQALFWAPHVFQALLGMACLAAVYFYLRRFLPAPWAQAGAILFSLDRLTVHYFFSVMTDLPSALFLLGAYLLGTRKGQRWGVFGLPVLAACLLCRWNMLAVPVGLALAAPFLSRRARGKALLIAAGSLALFILGNVLVYAQALGLPPLAAVRFLIHTLFAQFAQNSAPEPASGYLRTLLAGAGPAACLLFAAGILSELVEREGQSLWQAAFFAYFFALMTFLVGHKESRYLFPILPTFYLFVALGLKSLYEKVGRAAPRWAAACLLAAAGASALVGAGREWARFSDPAYRSPTLVAGARAIDDNLASGRQVYWAGFAHSIVPKDPVFVPADAYYYLYHVPSLESVAYLTGQRVRALEPDVVLQPGDLLVVAPTRVFLLDHPITAAQDRLLIWRAVGKRRLELVAAFD